MQEILNYTLHIQYIIFLTLPPLYSAQQVNVKQNAALYRHQALRHHYWLSEVTALFKDFTLTGT